MASVTAPANLPALVHAAFVRARAAGDLSFFATQVELLRVNGIPFQLRFAPSLASKPKAVTPATTGRGDGKGDKGDGESKGQTHGPMAPFDPFADPPAGLVVLPQLGPDHRLVLNKFAICADHAILATTAFRPQHHLLDGADLAAAYACIEAYAGEGKGEAECEAEGNTKRGELFVFYNSGRSSGASQPHRHLQLLPVARMREGLTVADAAAWDVLVDTLVAGPCGSGGGAAAVPFGVAAAALPQRPSPGALHALYLALYRRACALALADHADDAGVDDDEAQGRVPARISYNLALTRRTMAVLPRTAEGAPVGPSGTAAKAGVLSLNGTVLAGTALVKTAAEWEALRGDPAQLTDVLAQIGVSSVLSRGTRKSPSL